MKKLKYLLLLCAFAILSTGCVKFKANMDIKADKSMDFSIIYAFDKSLMASMGEGSAIDEKDMEEAKKQGFTVEKYTEDNYEGFKITKKIANIDDVSSENDVIYDISGLMEEQTDDNKYIFKVVKGEDKNTYTAKIKFSADTNGMMDDQEETIDNTETTDEETNIVEDDINTPDETLTTGSENLDGANDDLSNLDLSGLMNNLDLTFNVSLPNAAISSNATTKDNNNKNLSWKLKGTGEQMIEFSFDISNKASSNMLLYIGIGVIALILIALIILFVSKKKGNAEKEIVPSASVSPENSTVVPNSATPEPEISSEQKL